jgi:uncharacterized paraquat-inducible protein A
MGVQVMADEEKGNIKNFKSIAITCERCGTSTVIPIMQAKELLARCPTCQSVFVKNSQEDPVRFLMLAHKAAEQIRGCEISIACEDVKDGR